MKPVVRSSLAIVFLLGFDLVEELGKGRDGSVTVSTMLPYRVCVENVRCPDTKTKGMIP